VQGDGLQTGFRPSKGGNEAMPTHIFSETGLDYIVQAKAAERIKQRATTTTCSY